MTKTKSSSSSHQVALTRRQLLALSGGMGVAALSPNLARAAEAPPLKSAAAGPSLSPAPRASLRINNPYETLAGRWLKGDPHCHVDWGISTGGPGRTTRAEFCDGHCAADIYAAAAAAGLDFVCMSVDVLDSKGGTAFFGDVGKPPGNVIGIPAQEIQNNYYFDGTIDGQGKSFFSEAGARFLHVLTLGGPGGLSLCAHPLYYELGNYRAGGCWDDIKEALLNPDAGGALAGLEVRGVEIYNGFTLRKAREQSRDNAEAYQECFDEGCWDDLLEKGRLCWGFAGNDSFFGADDCFDSFTPLGLVHVSVPQGAAAADVLGALDAGRFYSSTGVELAAEPLEAVVDGNTLRVEVSARSPVDWCARIYQRVDGTWRRTRAEVENSTSAAFEVSGDEWKYLRISCRSRRDCLQRAWLQPITNQRYFPPLPLLDPSFRPREIEPAFPRKLE